MADKYDVSKQDVLLSSGDTSAAVRLALGETQIVEDTRKFLQSEGVKVGSMYLTCFMIVTRTKFQLNLF